MKLFIQQYTYWNPNEIVSNGHTILDFSHLEIPEKPMALYRSLGIQYPKFFKMDPLSKVAFLTATLTIPDPIEVDNNKVATIITTTNGCITVDKQFQESMQHIASPALFVYTLPNIMLGEICIKYGFKGEQTCLIAKPKPWHILVDYITDLIQHQGTQACLCGYVDVTNAHQEASLFWVNTTPSNHPFSEEYLNTIIP
jgi:hypothetical protein